jgi:protein-disulfide isomerase
MVIAVDLCRHFYFAHVIFEENTKMKSRKITVLAILAALLVVFLLGMNAFQKRVQNSQAEKISQALHTTTTATDNDATKSGNRLVRFHSPVFGPNNAPVTIVEFFDPACETCRAFYAIVKNILQQYPQDVRLVIRYAPFHPGSDEVVKLLEAAKRQNKYSQVMEAILAAQPQWADHVRPNVSLAYAAAESVGLDMAKARVDVQGPDIAAVLRQDIEDLTALEVTKTPTFIVNGRGLPSFGEQQLWTLVDEEVKKNKK